jgi:hypothetical protein
MQQRPTFVLAIRPTAGRQQLLPGCERVGFSAGGILCATPELTAGHLFIFSSSSSNRVLCSAELWRGVGRESLSFEH